MSYNRESILNDYKVNDKGIITSLGKFQGEMLYTPYFWEVYLNGDGEVMEDDTIYMNIVSEDIDEFPELANKTRVYLTCDDNGFIYCDVV